MKEAALRREIVDDWAMFEEDTTEELRHGICVSNLAYCVAKQLGLYEDQCHELAVAGLLHDIGRFRQYEAGIPHEEAGVQLAEEILKDCGFDQSEQEQVLELIRGHRTRQKAGSLPELFYRVDKLSRNCFSCPAEEKCDWPKEKKNLEIRM